MGGCCGRTAEDVVSSVLWLSWVPQPDQINYCAPELARFKSMSLEAASLSCESKHHNLLSINVSEPMYNGFI